MSRRSFTALAIGSLATAGAFAPSPGLMLSPARTHAHRGRPSGQLSLNMQLPANLEHATLLATSVAESAYTNPEFYFPKFMTYPEGLVSGMTSYFNLFVPTFKARACSALLFLVCARAWRGHTPVHPSLSAAARPLTRVLIAGPKPAALSLALVPCNQHGNRIVCYGRIRRISRLEHSQQSPGQV